MRGTFSIGKPSYEKSFSHDLAIHFHNHFLDRGKQIFLHNVVDECIVYATDICLHFKQESGGLLPEDWLQHLVAETYDVIIKFFPAAEESFTFDICLGKVKFNLETGIGRKFVDDYYGKF